MNDQDRYAAGERRPADPSAHTRAGDDFASRRSKGLTAGPARFTAGSGASRYRPAARAFLLTRPAIGRGHTGRKCASARFSAPRAGHPPTAGAGTMGMTTDRGLTVTPAPPDIADGLSMGPPPRTAPAAPGWADQAVLTAYREHYGSLVRQAARLVRDIPTAEDVVQDSFLAIHLTGPRLENSAKALAYLRQSVVNRSRSVLRRRVVADQHRPAPAPDMPSAEDCALTRLEHSAVISALAILAPRQRQVLALKFFADMSEAQVAAALGISTRTVKTHTSRALTSLRPTLKTCA